MTDEEIAGRYEHKTYVGRSKRARIRQPSLKVALKDAYTKAKADNEAGKLQTFRVLDMWAVGTNPLTEYIVALGPPDS
jgi:hypothetical protein